MAGHSSKKDFDGDAAVPSPDPLRNATGTKLTPRFDRMDEHGGPRAARFSDADRQRPAQRTAKQGN